MLTALQAAAVVTLWRSGRFDTLDIAGLLFLREPDVVTVRDAVRAAERGDHGLALIAGGQA